MENLRRVNISERMYVWVVVLILCLLGVFLKLQRVDSLSP